MLQVGPTPRLFSNASLEQPEMHRALFIREVLVNIFYWQRYAFPKGRATLCALSRTCRTFHDPALDALWRELDHIKPLVLCLPKDLYSIESNVGGQGLILKQVRPLTSADWSIFERYAARVQGLKLRVWESRNSPIMNVDTKFLLALSCPPSAVSLFPRLRLIQWVDERPESILFLRSVASPSLLHLTISPKARPWVWDASRLSMLSSLGSLCPSLKYIQLPSLDNLKQPVVATTTQLLSYLSGLESVEVSRLDASAFTHLASLRSLKSLSFILDPSLPALCSRQQLCEGFEGLTDLTIRSGALQSVLSLLAMLQISINNIDVDLSATPDVDATGNFFLVLSSRCAAETLRRVSVAALGDTSTPPLTMENIKPLFSFNQKKSELASAWPHLEELHLNDESGWGIQSKVTFNGLLYLLRNCCQLRFLSIALNTDPAQFAQNNPRSLPASGMVHGNLIHLSVVDSELTEAAVIPVAAWTSAVLPNLKEGFIALAYEQLWYEASKQHDAFVAIRKQERSSQKDLLKRYIELGELNRQELVWGIQSRHPSVSRPRENVQIIRDKAGSGMVHMYNCYTVLEVPLPRLLLVT
ncbi:hypothetical protein HYDPIDRAFT_27880 [Hydnomerulius pinastri MD-312]|uniref:F-box domain-containing protein n=1 Tax=Hydnomerulius pinastri MD-312 TaxID=994086 RepID=A0A0C9WAX3_9AGAM|nr:hypothetical protein HYDPIDRAFT_27880 [Hydnomerulius pinastri MD-312]